jgi:3'(2'), 5'-bisphosphate nucleotidase
MIDDLDLRLLPEELLEIARGAGEIIMDHRGNMGSLQLKEDSSPLTAADLLADQFICSALEELFPEIDIVSEENGGKTAKELFWLVDPLDGTKEFISGSDDFTVNIALIRNGVPILGIVLLPATNTAYLGGVNIPSTKITEWGAEPLRVRGLVEVPSIAVSQSHLDEKTEDFCQRFETFTSISAGSSLKLCLIAEGKADLYPRFGRTMERDIAAGQALLENAGGAVLMAENLEPLSYGKPGLDNPSFVAIGDAAWKGKLKEL